LLAQQQGAQVHAAWRRGQPGRERWNYAAAFTPIEPAATLLSPPVELSGGWGSYDSPVCRNPSTPVRRRPEGIRPHRQMGVNHGGPAFGYPPPERRILRFRSEAARCAVGSGSIRPSSLRVRIQSLRAALIGSMPASFSFVTHAVHQPMMDSTKRDREFVAGLATERPRLHEPKDDAGRMACDHR
jgi:hypothetical protein